MQHEVTKPVDLLDVKGRVIEEGWARRPVWRYDRGQIHTSSWRIKEWEYYAITNQRKAYCVTATMSDMGYCGMFAIAYIDYQTGKGAQRSAVIPFTFGKLGFKNSSREDQDLSWSNHNLRLAFITRKGKRHLLFACPSLVLPDGSVGLDCDLTLKQPNGLESMNIVTSWKENRKAFYLNEKINCMEASGTIRRGGVAEQIEQDGSAWGVLDWGRGRWTYQNRWYWSSASGLVDGIPFGFNLGYGFSDRTPASENVLIHNGIIHKLGDVAFHIPSDSYLKPWTFTSDDQRLELTFTPRYDRQSDINALVVKSVQHQVFGFFDGQAILDDGRVITLEQFPGFAEDVFNRW
ncbi:MAG: DUF2804 domain-containing protein [Sphaerochaeta sp.]|jgi:hypothetical protein|nr:DUF2804 domain-containing protein [Sphaerochaeta sp.]